MLKKAMYKKAHQLIGVTALIGLSTNALADNLPTVTSASTWIVTTMIGVAVSVLGMQIIYKLWQVSQGQKEPSEIVKPILITAAMVATPVLIKLIITAMGYTV